MDLVVEDTVVVELKAVAALAPIHHAQLLSYLKFKREANWPSDQLSFTSLEGRDQAICHLTAVFLCELCGDIALCVE